VHGLGHPAAVTAAAAAGQDRGGGGCRGGHEAQGRRSRGTELAIRTPACSRPGTSRHVWLNIPVWRRPPEGLLDLARFRASQTTLGVSLPPFCGRAPVRCE